MYAIHDLQKYAKERGGKCLSSRYQTNATNYEWECEHGHTFTKTWTTLLRKNSVWCLKCKHPSLETLQRFARSKGGRCLSTEYKRCDTKYDWECERGHTFTKRWADLCRKNALWCLQCKHPSIKTLQKHAQERGGKCLSEEYVNSSTNYKWKCSHGHEWGANWINVGYGKQTWCPKCRLIWSLDRFEEHARKRGGKCIQLLNGLGIQADYLFECENKHQFEARGANIIYNNTWCPQCQKLTLQECIDEARKRGGECLSTEYVNRRTPMLWKCGQGHRWEAPLGRIRNNNRWCAECVYEDMRHDISIAHELAEEKGGECLSTEYVNLETPLKWRCKEGHEWEVAMSGIKSTGQWCRMCHLRTRRDKAIDRIEKWIEILGGTMITERCDIPYDIHAKRITLDLQCKEGHLWSRTLKTLYTGSWCPKCHFKSETACHEILEEIFDTPFVKCRMACMDHLELDGYCEEFQLAFEYNGLQHEEYIPHFHRNGLQDFWKQQERDNRKRALCEQNGITLLEIPSTYDYSQPKLLRDYIQSQLAGLGM